MMTATSSLFETLPAQVAPERKAKPGPRLRTAVRNQIECIPASLDQTLLKDHRVRQVWAFVLRLNLSPILSRIKSVESHPGRPSADPKILVALWLYATIERIAHGREVARLCYEHIAFRWLCGGVGMNATTLNNFRIYHGDVLEKLLTDSFAALMKAGVANLKRSAQDGVRVRAAAGADSFRREKTIKEYLAEAEQRVRELRAEFEKNTDADANQRLAAQKRGAEDRERRVEEALCLVEELQAKQQQEAENLKHAIEKKEEENSDNLTDKSTKKEDKKKDTEPRVSTTDPTARVMKMADGGFRPAYNVQFISDTKSGAIAGVSVDNVGVDYGKATPMIDKIANDYGQRPEEHLIDGGYFTIEEVQALSDAGVTVYMPVKKSRDENVDVHKPKKKDSPEVAAWRERMGTEEGKEIYKERAATAECANAQARQRAQGSPHFLSIKNQ